MYDSWIKPIESVAAGILDSAADLVSGETEPLGSPSDEIRYPEDLCAKTNVQTEWWYYTGHLETESGRELGFELVFFKRRTDLDRVGVLPLRLVANPMYAAHFALTDITAGKFHYDHRRSLGGILDMPVVMSRESYDVKFGEWSVRDVGGSHVIHAELPGGIALDAVLDSTKPPVLNGEGDGFTKKSAGQSSHFSLTRMAVAGKLTENGTESRFTGSAWMDREFGTWNQRAWDWFSIQFNDGTELMIYRFPTADGGAEPYSGGTFVDVDGATTYVRGADFKLTPTGEWTSEATGTTWPSGWRLEVEKLGVDVTVEPYVKDQELDTRGTTMVVYWEGACSVSGRRAEADVDGRAYVELVGYNRSDLEMDIATFFFGDVVKSVRGLFG